MGFIEIVFRSSSMFVILFPSTGDHAINSVLTGLAIFFNETETLYQVLFFVKGVSVSFERCAPLVIQMTLRHHSAVSFP